MRHVARSISCVLLAFFLQSFSLAASETKLSRAKGYAGLPLGHDVALASEDLDQPDIEWFKKELRISPKYVEKHEGVLGLSWAHFLTMVFLIISFIVALLAVIIRYRRTKELLTLIMKEEQKNGSKS